MKHLKRCILLISIIITVNVCANERCENKCALAKVKCVSEGRGFSVCQLASANCKTACK